VKIVEVYSDGSSANRGGKPGGWSWIVCVDSQVVAADAGSDPETTNNIMEMTGALLGLRAVAKLRLFGVGHVVTLVSDSQVTLGLASGRYSPSTNFHIARDLHLAYMDVQARDRWVPGHSLKDVQKQGQVPSQDVIMNDRCDRLAHGQKEALKKSLGLLI